MKKYYLDDIQTNLKLSKQGMYDRMHKLNIEPIKERAYLTSEDFEKLQKYIPSKSGRPKKS